MRSKILVLSHDPSAWSDLGALAEVEDLVVETGAEAGLRRAATHAWDAVVVDESRDGAPAEERARACAASGGVVALATATPTLELAVRMEAAGVVLLAKPVAPASLATLLAGATDRGETVPFDVDPDPSGDDLVGRSPAMVEVFRAVGRLAPGDGNVLVEGEPGTGKRSIALALHDGGSRSHEPFVELACRGLPESLLESELFGHEPSTFPWAVAARKGRIERAAAGTLFLDQVEALTLRLQARLLDVLQSGVVERVGGDVQHPVSPRVVATCAGDLRSRVETGDFLDALHRRLGEGVLRLPPLRERGGDVLMLARRFGAVAARRFGRPVSGFTREAVRKIEGYGWPGNARELAAALEHAVLLTDRALVDVDHLPDAVRWPAEAVEEAPAVDGSPGVRASLEEVEAAHIRRVLRSTGGHLTRCADVLRIHRNTLRRKLKRYAIRT